MSSEAGHDEHGGTTGADHHEEERQGVLPSRDWIEAMGQKFRASSHVHLEKGKEREMLPWLQLSAELDPSKIEAFTVTAYWLRRLKKVDEAEQFLREGLRKNPGNPDLLNELAWLYFEDRKDSNRAKNIWLMALRRWDEVEKPKEKPDKFLGERILGGLAQAESELGQNDAAIGHLKELKKISPNPDAIQNWIEKLHAKTSGK